MCHVMSSRNPNLYSGARRGWNPPTPECQYTVYRAMGQGALAMLRLCAPWCAIPRASTLETELDLDGTPGQRVSRLT